MGVRERNYRHIVVLQDLYSRVTSQSLCPCVLEYAFQVSKSGVCLLGCTIWWAQLGALSWSVQAKLMVREPHAKFLDATYVVRP